MKLIRLLFFSFVGGVSSALGFARAPIGRRPIDWPAMRLASLDGAPLSTANYAGHVVLLVNTASLCGFTKQYRGLQALWERYRARGLVVLGVPSNDFGGQEPGSEAEIKDFCSSQYKISFPMTAKNEVVGGKAHPFYQWAVAQAGQKAAPQWNIHKYLIDGKGGLA